MVLLSWLVPFPRLFNPTFNLQCLLVQPISVRVKLLRHLLKFHRFLLSSSHLTRSCFLLEIFLFCGECLQPCLQVPSPLCPLCRLPFDPKKVDKATHVEKQLSSYKAPCRGCNKKVTLAKMRAHISSCLKVQEQMANCPKFVPVVPTSQPIPSNIPNRSTFACPYCGARNLDQQELVKHCVESHRSDPNRVVCPICSAMPWGDPSYKSANFLQHLLHRHKFSYDTFVDYSIDEEAAFQAALALSLSEN